MGRLGNFYPVNWMLQERLNKLTWLILDYSLTVQKTGKGGV